WVELPSQSFQRPQLRFQYFLNSLPLSQFSINPLFPKVLVLQGDREIMNAQCCDNRLQFIPALSGYTHLASLDLGGDFELTIANKPSHLFGHGLFESLFYFDKLASMAKRRDLRFPAVHVFQTDIAFGKLRHDDLSQGMEFKLVIS